MMIQISEGQNDKVFAFKREKNENTVVVVLNLSNSEQDFTIKSEQVSGEFKDVFSGEVINITENLELKLEPWQYLILTR